MGVRACVCRLPQASCRNEMSVRPVPMQCRTEATVRAQLVPGLTYVCCSQCRYAQREQRERERGRTGINGDDGVGVRLPLAGSNAN